MDGSRCAELLASSVGLGYMIQQGRYASKPALVFVGMIMIGIVGLLFDTILHWLEVKVAKRNECRMNENAKEKILSVICAVISIGAFLLLWWFATHHTALSKLCLTPL